jgi:uncharacterized protein
MRMVIGTAAALLAWVGVAGAQPADTVLRPGETLLEVQAEGVHRGRPDVMAVTAAVVTTGRTAAEALANNNEAAERVLARIRGLGVAPADIRTRNFGVRPQYAEERNRDEEPRIVGYTARNAVELRLRDLGRAGAIISAAFEAGANQVEGPRFSLSDDRPAVLAAQRDAVRLALEEAENYAAALGMRVARIVRASERGRSSRDDTSILVSGSRVTAVPVEPGEIETEVRLWVDFALVPR